MTAQTPTLTLAAYLLERYAEEEAIVLQVIAARERDMARWRAARAALYMPPVEVESEPEPAFQHDDEYDVLRVAPAHVLADLAAKRRIVELHKPRLFGKFTECEVCTELRVSYEPDIHHDWPCPTLRALATPFADRPDFEEAWR